MTADKARIEGLIDELARGARALRIFSHLGSEQAPVSNAAHHVLKVVLRQQPIHAAAVASYLGIGPGAMSRHVAELEAANLLVRVDCSTDARRQLLTVTDAGKELVVERDRVRAERLARLLPHWDSQRLDEAIELLGELNGAMLRGVGETKVGHESAKEGRAR